MKKFVCILIAACLVLACGPKPEEVQKANKESLAQKGEKIGTLPDGRDVTVHYVYSYNGDLHYVYEIGDSATVTDNWKHLEGCDDEGCEYSNHTTVSTGAK